MKNNSKEYKILLKTIPDGIACCVVFSACGQYISIANATTSQTIGVFLVDDSLKIQCIDNETLEMEQQRLSQKLIQFRFQNNNTQKFLLLISQQLTKHALAMQQKQLNHNNQGRLTFQGKYLSNYPSKKSIESVQITIDYPQRMLEVNSIQGCENQEEEVRPSEIFNNDHSIMSKSIPLIKQLQRIELSTIVDVLVGIKASDIQWYKFNKDIQSYLCVSIVFSDNSCSKNNNLSNEKITTSIVSLQLSSYSDLKSFLAAVQDHCAPFNHILTPRELAFNRVREILRQVANVNNQMTLGAYLRQKIISNGFLQDGSNQEKQRNPLDSYLAKQGKEMNMKINTYPTDLLKQQEYHSASNNNDNTLDLSVFKVNPKRISKGPTQLQFYERSTPNDSGNRSRRN